MARRIAAALELPYLELDSLMHQPNWTQLPTNEFQARVSEFVRKPKWVVDGNYTSHGVAQMVWQEADTVVWVDPPRRVVMNQIVRRTLRRIATGEELWNGNRGRWHNLIDPRPRENIILWAWTRYRHTREKYERHHASGTWAHLAVHRLTSSDQVEELEALKGK